MLHLTPQSIILEVCFCTSPEDVEAYRNNREKLAADLAKNIAELATNWFFYLPQIAQITQILLTHVNDSLVLGFA